MLQAMSMWRTIAHDLEGRIKTGVLSPGDKLPTEHDLSLQYTVNRHTVRRALAHLQARGLVESTQGRGSFVRRPTLEYRIQKRTRYSDNVRAHGNHRHETLAIDVRPADARVAEALGLRFGQPTIFLERLSLLNEQPTNIGRHWFSRDRLPHFPEMYAPRQSITAALRDSGIPDYIRVRTAVGARLPTPQESDLLNMPKHVPLLITHAINRDGCGQPLEFCESRFASDRVELLIEDRTEALAD